VNMRTVVPEYISGNSTLAPLLKHADHVDVKTITGTATLREFIAAMLSYQPVWVTTLYGVRAMFVRCLGMRQKRVPRASRLSPEKVAMQPDSRAGIFAVRMAQEGQYWIGEADDRHLRATLGVVVEPLSHHMNQFYVLTIVHYHHWTGPLYFNIIRPFHHLVVGQMVKAGIRKF
jgi:hypothetical protein